MPLDVRVYKCPVCDITIDRDLNAAINIRNFALRTIISNFKNTDGRSGINAFGDGSSGKHDASCACETAVNESGKFSGLKSENGNHLQ